jgi:hypothetical protein
MRTENTLTLLLRAIWILPWLVISLSGVVTGSSPLSVASASIRSVCQVISLNVKTWKEKVKFLNSSDEINQEAKSLKEKA